MPSADFCPITSCITTWSATTNDGRKAGQISPGKNTILPCTTAAFTIPHFLQAGFVMLCSLTQGFGLICDFCPSARRFALRLLSDARSPSRPCLRLVLFKVDSLSSSWKMYKGLSPYKIMPMPGTHKANALGLPKTAPLRSAALGSRWFATLWAKGECRKIYLVRELPTYFSNAAKLIPLFRVLRVIK